MKVVTDKQGTAIYPFLGPKERKTNLMGRIVVYPNGLIRLDEFDKMTMSADIAQKLIDGLLHAVNIAQKGPKWAKNDGS